MARDDRGRTRLCGERRPAARSTVGQCAAQSTMRSRGFTLIELLVAVFVSAIMFALGYAALGQVITQRGRVQAQQQAIDDLQRAMRVMTLDLGEARILDKPRKIALIYKNVDKAPAQDVGLVVVEQDSASTALRVTHEFRLQVKYFTAGSGMQDWEIASEFFKMGSRKVAHVAGGIVAALKKPKSSTSLYITAEEICKAASECGVGQAPKLRDQNVSWSGQWRSSLFSALCGAEELCESQKHSDDASSSLTLSLIAFFESAQQKQSKHQDKMDEGIFAVSMAEHMFPAAMNAVSCAKVDDVVRVSIQCTAVEGMPDAATT